MIDVFLKNKLSFIIISVLFMSCNNGPKVITEQSNKIEVEHDSGIFSEGTTKSPEQISNSKSYIDDGVHKVVVNEILPAKKYEYLKVTEEGEQFWIATRKKEIIIGETYYYKRGLLKTNFESKEYNKIFERIILVSNLVSENHQSNAGQLNSVVSNNENHVAHKEKNIANTENISQKEGSISIAELVSTPKKYEGKTIQLTGKCVKINPNIMERNWIHLQDGSKNDYDLVITSDTFVPEGNVITIQALVSIDRDFGAGYQYSLILENGIILK